MLSLTLVVLAGCGGSSGTRSITAAGFRAPVVRDGALRVPILLYHHVGPSGRRWRSLFVSLPQFARQMAALSASGAQSLTMEELYDAVRLGRSFARGAVALTFDDATEDQYVFAYPLLKQYKLHATFFVPAGLVGRSGYMTWAQLAEMKRSGHIAIEPHTVLHRDLTQLPPADALREIQQSRAILHARLGVRARQFAYPFGKYDSRIESMLRRLGFESAVTTRYQIAHPIRTPFEWGRLEVHDTNVPANLATLATMSGSWHL